MAENIDTITLGGQTLRVIGPVAGKAISEFTAGLKVGPATYDERLHAFWVSMGDFSGGVGHRQEDIRNETGVLWDNLGGVDTRRAQNIILPPLQDFATMDPPSSYSYLNRWPSQPIFAFKMPAAGYFYCGLGSGIYSSADGGTTLTKILDVLDSTGTPVELISAILEFNGSLFAFPCAYPTLPDRANYLYCPGTSDPTDSGNWVYASGTTLEIYDAVVFDQKLVGTCRDATYGLFPQIVFSTDGLSWNITDGPNDLKPIWQGTGGNVRFVGVLAGTWGEPAIYFLANGKWGISLYCLDFYARKAYEIQMAPGSTVMDAVIWNSQVIVSDGYTIYSYTPNGEIVREMGLPRKGGIPPCFQYAQFVRLFAVGPYLYCTVNQTDIVNVGQVKTQVWCWNGAGWSPFGEQVSNFGCLTAGGFADFSPMFLTVQRRIVLLGNDVPTATPPVATKRLIMDLPWYADTPTYGVDNFAAGPVSFITPWFDGGFHDLDGALFWLRIAGYHLSATETVKVEYAVDYNETTWTQMRNSSGNAAVFTAHTDTLYFKTTSPAKKGLQFRNVRFRITLARRTSGTAPEKYTPEIQALTLCYNKKPLLRTAWAINLDVSGMLERPQDYKIGSSNFTLELLWAKLAALWNEETLLTLLVPNVLPAAGALVELEAMSGTFEDFRDAVKGKGVISITCLEPIDA